MKFPLVITLTTFLSVYSTTEEDDFLNYEDFEGMDPYGEFDPYGGYGDPYGYGGGGGPPPFMEIESFEQLLQEIQEEPLVVGYFNLLDKTRHNLETHDDDDQHELSPDEQKQEEELMEMIDSFIKTAEKFSSYGFRFAVSTDKSLIKRHKIGEKFRARVYTYYPPLIQTRMAPLKYKEKKRFPGASVNTFTQEALENFVATHYFTKAGILTPEMELAAIFSEVRQVQIYTRTNIDEDNQNRDSNRQWMVYLSTKVFEALKAAYRDDDIDPNPVVFFLDKDKEYQSFDLLDYYTQEEIEKADFTATFYRDPVNKKMFKLEDKLTTDSLTSLMFFGSKYTDGAVREGIKVFEEFKDLDEFDPVARSMDLDEERDNPAQDIDESNVVTIEMSQLDSFLGLKSSALIFVEFYAEWCGYCQKFKSEYAALGNTFAADESIIFIKVEADKERPPDGFIIEGFPTLYYIAPNEKPQIYEGGMSSESIAAFITTNLQKSEGTKDEL
eukprot:snap_masked-scaffold_21-processed-gene-4.8-mRNA-1 protein AED:1.00 eAED:1.00 QI:0/-1/0/0/-1/1/1/0/497